MPKYDYTDGQTTFQGYMALPKINAEKAPCILVAHAWDGPNDYFNALADALAAKGFIAFAIDVYGKGQRGKIDGDNSHLMNPLLADRFLLKRRLLAALAEMHKNPLVDAQRIAILGYCFGGLCALDLARANPQGLCGAISIHGQLLAPPQSTQRERIDSSILVLHGWEDPFVSPQMLTTFAQEMTSAQADWQIHCYGHAKHAFTFVDADIPQLGIKYNKEAHERALRATDDFLKEIFDLPRANR